MQTSNQKFLQSLAHTTAHALAALAALLLLPYPLSPDLIIITITLGLIPDIDHELQLPHRAITHSLFALFLIYLAAAATAPRFVITAASIAGYGSHLIIDMLHGLTGVQLLYPLRRRFTLANLQISTILTLTLTLAALAAIMRSPTAAAATTALMFNATPTPRPTATATIPPTQTPTPRPVYVISRAELEYQAAALEVSYCFMTPENECENEQIRAALAYYRLCDIAGDPTCATPTWTISPTPTPSLTPAARPTLTPTLAAWELRAATLTTRPHP